MKEVLLCTVAALVGLAMVVVTTVYAVDTGTTTLVEANVALSANMDGGAFAVEQSEQEEVVEVMVAKKVAPTTATEVAKTDQTIDLLAAGHDVEETTAKLAQTAGHNIETRIKPTAELAAEQRAIDTRADSNLGHALAA